jgi:hypothetical protein
MVIVIFDANVVNFNIKLNIIMKIGRIELILLVF